MRYVTIVVNMYRIHGNRFLRNLPIEFDRASQSEGKSEAIQNILDRTPRSPARNDGIARH
jgi:hypothetical protein